MHKHPHFPGLALRTQPMTAPSVRRKWRTGRRVCQFLAGLSCALSIASAQTAFDNFDAVGGYVSNFNPWNDVGGLDGGNYSFAEDASMGTGGTGGVSVFQSNDTTATYNKSWDFSTNGASLTVSVLLKANGQISGNKVQLGIINSSHNGLNNNSGIAFESFRIVPSSATSFTLREQFRTGGGLTENQLGTINTTIGNWYRFVVTFTNLAGSTGSYNAACAIFDYGTNGMTPGSNIVGFSTLASHTGQADITVAAMWPALRAFQNAGIDAWDDFLVYTPSSAPVITSPIANNSVPTGKSARFEVLADGPGTINYAWFTNGVAVTGVTLNSFTTPPLNSSYTNIEVVASNANGSTTNSVPLDVFVPTTATLTNQPASGVQTTAAVLNGQVLATGGDTPDITLFYGPNDGGNNPAAWANNVNVGLETAAYSKLVTGLTPNVTYHFTARAVNSVGTSWAPASQSFTTLPITLAIITNLPATQLQTTIATLNGEVLSTGNDTPGVTLYYGPTDGGTSPGNWAQSVFLGIQTAQFAQTVSGLSSNATYYFAAAASNAAGIAWAQPSGTFTTPLTNAPAPPAVAVLTQHNDNARDGANLEEVILNTSNVNTNQFGLVATRPVDDQIYAQPLVMTNVNIVGKGVHNVVVVATVNDSVYAFDADDPSVTAPYWQTSFLGPNARAPRNSDMTGACGGNYQDFSGNMGIVGTPVIDPVSGTIYLVARTLENGTTFVQRLHALDIRTGLDRTNAAVIAATYAGTGAGSVAGVLHFDPQKANQRPGLALVNGVVYITWSSHCDWGPYHGWVIGYDAQSLRQVYVFNDTPNGSNGGIWMSGQAPAADANGNLYLSTGNGTVDTSGGPNRGESFLRLTPGGTNLTLSSWFTPYNWPILESGDIDLGSGGVLLIPGTALLLSGGKEGVMYLVNRDNMGGLSGGSSDTNVVQTFAVTSDEVHGGAVWWNISGGPYAYLWPSSVRLQQYRFDTAAGKFVLPAFAQGTSTAPNGQPGGLLALSANGNLPSSGILWASHQLTGDANQSVRPGILRAYDARNVGIELWNSQINSSRDAVGSFAKFVPPTVANGKVYLATFSGQVDVYGLLPSATPAQLKVSPSRFDFGLVPTGQTSNTVFQVSNTGGLTLTGTAAVAPPFHVLSGATLNLAGGQTGQVQVAFSPTASGSFTNNLVFTSNGGNSTNTVAGASASVPVANFTGSPTFGSAPLDVAFTDSSTGTITNRSWSFGDNSTTNTTATTLVHSYAGPGTNSVSLTVSGPLGSNSLTRPEYVVVTAVGPSTLVLKSVGNQLELSWPAGTLQTALQVTGPYTNLAVISPFVITPSNGSQFFRIKQ